MVQLYTFFAFAAIGFLNLENIKQANAFIIPSQVLKSPQKVQFPRLMTKLDDDSIKISSQLQGLENSYGSIKRSNSLTSFNKRSGSIYDDNNISSSNYISGTTLKELSKNFQALEKSTVTDAYDLRITHKLLSFHITPFQVETMCYYNIYDKDEAIYLDVIDDFEVLTSFEDNLLGHQVDAVKQEIESQTKLTLLSADDFGETRRSCLIVPDAIAKIAFQGRLVMATVEYKLDLVSKKPKEYGDDEGFKKGKILLNFPVDGYKFDCLHGSNNCDLKTAKFSTNFKD